MDPHILKVKVNPHHHHAPISLFSFSDIALKHGQDFAAGYHHPLDAVSTFLSSAGSSLDQNTTSHLSDQLKTTTEMRAAIVPVPSFKVWQRQEDSSSTKPLPSPAFFCVAPPSALLSSSPQPRSLPSLSQMLGRPLQLRSHHLKTRTSTGVCYVTKQHGEAVTEPAIS